MTEASPEAVTVFPLLWYKFKTYASLQKPRADSLRTIAQHNQTETQYASYDNLWGHQNNKKAHKTCALAYMETEFQHDCKDMFCLNMFLLVWTCCQYLKHRWLKPSNFWLHWYKENSALHCTAKIQMKSGWHLLVKFKSSYILKKNFFLILQSQI